MLEKLIHRAIDEFVRQVIAELFELMSLLNIVDDLLTLEHRNC